MKITALVDSRNASWLKLSGISVQVYDDPSNDGRKLLRKLVTGDEYGIVICTPEIMQENETIVQQAFKNLFPVILELPTSDKPAAIQELVRNAIGVDIKF